MENEKLIELSKKLVELKQEVESADYVPEDDRKYINHLISKHEKEIDRLGNDAEENKKLDILLQKVHDFGKELISYEYRMK